MVWATDHNSLPSSRSRRRYLSLATKPGNFSDCGGRHSRQHRSSLRCRSIVVTATIAALALFLFPSAKITFTQAFRSLVPRRGSALVSDIIPTARAAGTASATLHSRTNGPVTTAASSSSSRNLHTRCHLFSRKSPGPVAVPYLSRGMVSSPTPPTSLSSTASSFFFPKPASTEGVETDQEVYTMESLCSYAERLIARNSNKDHRFCVYLAGGGSMAVSALVATPGASSFLLEGRTTYDRHSYLNACEIPDRDTKGKGFSYGGQEAATIASNAALKQALKLASMDDDLKRMPLTVGIGCASVLVSGEGSSSGRGTVVARTADGLVLTLSIQMKERGRSRFEEDLVLSHLVLRSAEQLMIYREDDANKIIAKDKEFITRAGDVITERWELPTTLVDDDTDDAAVVAGDIDAVVEAAAKRVVDGGEDAVVLLPTYDDQTTKSKPVSVRALSQTVLPNKSLVFPGSFNPVHVGHIGLANASVKTLEKHEPYIHPRRHNEKPIFFELSLVNADKPSIDPKIVASRVKKFLELASLAGEVEFPQQWGIVLTRAPLFEEKLKILRSKVLNRLEGPDGSPRINFVIGTDTLVRILNPKYYRDKSRANMIESLLELKAHGAGFIVGGRLEQTSSLSSPRFVSGRDELEGLPDQVASMFKIMEESEFRVDLSSSEIRKQQEKQERETIRGDMATSAKGA